MTQFIDHRGQQVKPMKAERRILIRLADLASLAAILGVGWYGIFVLPYSFPPKVPVFDSPSYNVGFNNSISAIAVAGVIGLLCLRNLFWRPRMPEPVENIFWTGASCGARRHPPMPRSLFALFGGIYAIGTCFIYAYVPRLEVYGEAAGAMPTLQLFLNTNLQPFRDFNYGYGPLLLYLPAFVIKVATELLGTSFKFGYLLGVLVCLIGGLWMLFYLVDHLRIRTAHRMVIFSATAIAAYDISLGTNCTMLRYVLPFVITLTIHKAAERIIAGQGKWTNVTLSAISMIGVLGVLAISPEFGTVFLLAHAAYCAHRAWFQQRIWIFPLLATLASYPIWIAMFPATVDHRILEPGRCFGNFPVVPAPSPDLCVLESAGECIVRVAVGSPVGRSRSGSAGPL